RHTRSKRDWSSDVCSSDLRMYFEISMVHQFAQYVKDLQMEERKQIFNDHVKLKSLIESARKAVGTRVQMQHMLQYLLLPDYFEQIGRASCRERVLIKAESA